MVLLSLSVEGMERIMEVIAGEDWVTILFMKYWGTKSLSFLMLQQKVRKGVLKVKWFQDGKFKKVVGTP